MDKCVDGWSMNLWMNKCHRNFASSNKSMWKICFKSMILVHKTYKLWMNEFCMTFITKSWDAKFLMPSYRMHVYNTCKISLSHQSLLRFLCFFFFYPNLVSFENLNESLGYEDFYITLVKYLSWENFFTSYLT
jgi:hypothetical protein